MMICPDQASGETKEEQINKAKEVGERQRKIRLQRMQGTAGDERLLSYLSFERMSPLFCVAACQDIDQPASET